MTPRSGLRLAIVSEGPSDYLVLRSVIEKILPGSEVLPIHPDLPVAVYPEYGAAVGGAHRGSGWLGVKAWCADYSGEDLELFLRAVVGQEYDGLIVHVDASMAGNLDINEPCPPVSSTTEPLRRVIVEDWLRLVSQPSFLVLATPSKTTDAWVVAALDPSRSNLECDHGVERALVRLGRLRTKGGRVQKSRDRYESLARAVAAKISQVRSCCSEADRFATDIERLSGAQDDGL